MSLKKVFSDILEKTCRENVVGALILSALAVFGFARTASALSQISAKPTTTDSVAIIPREKAEKIAKPAEKPAEKALAIAHKTSVSTVASARVASVAGSTTANSAGSFVTIAGANIPLFTAGNTLVDPGNKAAAYGRMVYGHRGTAFGNIANLPIGSSFTITRNGATENYVVAGAVTLDKSTTSRFMYSLTNQASYKGQTYSLVLMTCAGAPGDNGDASHRLMLFVEKI